MGELLLKVNDREREKKGLPKYCYNYLAKEETKEKVGGGSTSKGEC